MQVASRSEAGSTSWFARAGRLGAMWRVTLPLAAPGVATTAVLCFLEFMLALTSISDEARKTLPGAVKG